MRKKITLQKYGEFIAQTFTVLNIPFQKGKKILDVGCGGGEYCEVFSEFYDLDTYGIDIYKDEKIKNLKDIKFKTGSIFDIKFRNNYFDYVFLHDVLHHVDEKKQSKKKHKNALEELKRVTKKGGKIIIVEANRYNPLFYPHMVRMRKHDHWKQSYFNEIMREVFPPTEYETQYIYFEAHAYPWGRK